MKEYQIHLTKLLELTEELNGQVKVIHTNMKENEPEQLEIMQSLMEQREECINALDKIMKQVNFKWAEEDQPIIYKLKDLEQSLQPRMTELHQSFVHQMNRIKQTKQMSKKYMGAYQNMTTDGSFIDKRK